MSQPQGWGPPPGSGQPPPGSGYGPPQGTPPGYGAPPGARDGYLAGVGRRIGAKAIDTVLVVVVTTVLGFLVGVASALGTGAFDDGQIGLGANLALTVVVGLVTGGLTLAYYVGLEVATGRTLGKLLVSAKVVGPDGTSRPTLGQAFRRNSYYLLTLLAAIPVLGYVRFPAYVAVLVALIVTVADDPADRGFHDRLAGGTTVVKA